MNGQTDYSTEMTGKVDYVNQPQDVTIEYSFRMWPRNTGEGQRPICPYARNRLMI